MQGKRKLAQNRGAENRAGIVAELRERAREDDLAIAEEMESCRYGAEEAASAVDVARPGAPTISSPSHDRARAAAADGQR